MTLCHFVCGSLEQNRGHGRLVSALPGSFLPPLMTSKTTRLQKISILTSCSSSLKARCLGFRTSRKGPAVQLYAQLYKCLYTIRISSVFPFLKVNGSSKIQSAKRTGTCHVSLHQKSQEEALETRREVSSRLWIQCQLLLIVPTLSRYRRLQNIWKVPILVLLAVAYLLAVNSFYNNVFVNT